jgi:uncharacterized protein
VIIFLLVIIALSISAAPAAHQYINGNYSFAVKALHQAEKGDALSQYEFALMCEKGEGIPQNHVEAVKWFRQAALQDYAPAQLFLGLMYASGKGVGKDERQALVWLHAAADQNNTTAQFYLGGLYFSSTNVHQDYVQAYKWFVLAGRNDPSRLNTLESVSRRMTPSQMMEAQRQIQNWTPRKTR